MKYGRWWLVVVSGLWSCSLATQIGGHGPSAASSPPGDTGEAGNFTIPNVFAMSRSDAVAAMEHAGYRGTVEFDTRSSCGSAIDGTVIELDHVCRQQPAPGQQSGARLPITLLIQSEDPRQGRVGETMEWHLMPNLVGLTHERAIAALRAAGFSGDEEQYFVEREIPGCDPGIVCKQFPDPLTRALLRSGRAITVGATPKPAAVEAVGGVDAGVPAATPDAASPGSLF